MSFGRRGILLSALLLGLLAMAAPAAAETAGQISQFGITWTFAEPATCGQFANGDYWVVGPVRITAIDPPSTVADGRTRNGSMLNPGLGQTQGYDSAMYGAYGPNYSAALNVALGVSPAAPLTVAPGSSLISSLSIDLAGNRPQLKTAAVLTVLAAPAPAGSFRPPYFGPDKTIRYNVSQLDLARLPRLAPVTGTPNLTTVTNKFERPWLEHVLSWTGRYCHPQNNMPDYGRDMAMAIGDAMLSLMLDYTAEQKQPLLVRLTQYGIDLYAIAAGGGVWEDLGGHMHGRKLPILLAGLVLHDADLSAIGTALPNRFQEDRQVWVVVPSDVGRALYHADGRPRVEYLMEDVGLPEWGEQHYRQPNRDGRNWDAYYRRNVGHSILAHVLAARLLGLKEAWQWPPLFDYLDRYWAIEQNVTGTDAITTFHKNMWRSYRDYVPLPAADLTIAGWALAAAHGPAGLVTTPLVDGYIESRQIAAPRLVITFSQAVAPASAAAGAVTISGAGGGDRSALIGSLTLDSAGTQLTVALASPLPSPDIYTITVTGALHGTAGQSVTGDADVQLRLLAGDVDASGAVSRSDILALRTMAGQALTPATVRYDMNCSGAITGADLLAIRQGLGHQLP